MINFHQIAAGVDVGQLLHALQRQPDLWGANKIRAEYDDQSPHREVKDILLRFPDTSKISNVGDLNSQRCVAQPAWLVLPQARPIIFDLLRRVEAVALERVMITKLAPGKAIYPHADIAGEYARDPDGARYHVVLQGFPGSLFRAGDETVCMRTGEVWWFNHAVEHEVINNSKDDRIHLLIDTRNA